MILKRCNQLQTISHTIWIPRKQQSTYTFPPPYLKREREMGGGELQTRTHSLQSSFRETTEEVCGNRTARVCFFLLTTGNRKINIKES